MGRLGDPAILNCSALAIPTASYQWSRDEMVLTPDGTRLIADNGSLLFSELVRDDSGLYECTASNIYGGITSQPAQLTVQGGCKCGT